MSRECEELHLLANQLNVLTYPVEYSNIPTNGIYIMFERGEFGHSGKRIVRIGAHTGDGNLRQRLKEHFEKENKDRSIFRKNIGLALLNKNHDPFISQWKRDLTTSANRKLYGNSISKVTLNRIEKKVSGIIRDNFSVVVVPVDAKEMRIKIEAELIATVAKCTECDPSGEWFGLHSPKPKIRESGLWQEQKLKSRSADLETIRQVIQ